MTQRYSVALYVPFVVRVSGIAAASPADAIAQATACAQGSRWLQQGLMDGAHDCTAKEPTLCYVEPHEPADPIGALVDVVDSAEGEVIWDHAQTGQYHPLEALQCYARNPER